ncbi:unnamed protein product [Phytophthora lilii]|uniref:Unnamed protein product n=1 Tax=Phytophthora lilii TaxID=2077276 RepID=A0A9W6WIT5_9STRA|nr:unnamed protein product [Phytophthora lilii]
MFHVTHKCQFDRVFLPRTDPERVKLSTGDYGENGYGNKTDNPIDVDFPSLQLTKSASLLVKDQPAGSLISKLTISDTDINNLLSGYSTAISNKDSEPYFSAGASG